MGEAPPKSDLELERTVGSFEGLPPPSLTDVLDEGAERSRLACALLFEILNKMERRRKR